MHAGLTDTAMFFWWNCVWACGVYVADDGDDDNPFPVRSIGPIHLGDHIGGINCKGNELLLLMGCYRPNWEDVFEVGTPNGM